MTERADAVPLRGRLGRMRRHWLLLTVCPLLGAALGTAVLLAQPPVFEATTDIVVGNAPVALADTTATEFDPLTLDTEAERLRSDEVLRAVEDSGAAAALTRLHVTAIPNTTVLRVTSVGTNAAEAEHTANVVAARYLESRSEYLDTRLAQRTGVLRRTVQALQTRLEAMGTDVAGRSQLDRARLSAYRAAAASSELELRTVQGSFVAPGRVLRAAEAGPGHRPNPTVHPTSGALLGLVLASLYVAVRAARGREVRP